MNDLKNLFDLKGKTAFISGGGTGIGKLSAETLATYGANVVLAGRRLEKLEETAESIRKMGVNAHCVSMDITNAQSVGDGFKQATSHGPVTILVNSAGVVSQPALVDLDEDEWNKVLDTNLKGGWLLAKEAAKHMIAAGQGGSIIQIASILGTAVQKGTGPYMASKAGLIHLTKTMSVEWARYGIRANAIAPGYIRTDIAEKFLDTEAGGAMVKRIPMRRLGDLPDLAGAVLLLASQASAYMTGTVITVDGGHSLPTI